MKPILKSSAIILLSVVASLFIFSTSVFAALETPYFSYVGTWSYDEGTNALTTSIDSILSIRYKDGSFDTSPYDTIKYGKFVLGEDNGSGGGVVYNGGADSMVFGSTVGVTGNMNFSVFEGDVNYFNGTMHDFSVTKDEFGTRLNPDYEADHIEITSVNSIVSSEFLDDINSIPSPFGNLYIDFSCSTDGCNNDFTTTTSGTLLGKFSVVSVVPEPISAFLFISGGITLVFRRFYNI